MTQTNSQAFDSGLGSLPEVEEELEATKVKVKQLEEKLAINDENSKDVKRQLVVQIEDLHKKLTKKEAEVKELKKQITKLENQIWQLNYLREKIEKENRQLNDSLMGMEKKLQDQEQDFTSQIEQANQKCDRLEKETVVRLKFCEMLVRCTPPESGYILIMLDVYVRLAGIEYLEAYRHLREAFTKHAPQRPFPPLEDLEKLRQKWAEWYDKTTPPCFIKTVCDWYCKEASEIPYHHFGYIPGFHQGVSEEFLRKHFYIVYSLEFEERRKMSVVFFEENYVICYHKRYGDGHMCVVSKEELEYMINNDGFASFVPQDEVLRDDIRFITRFFICLPRGTSFIDPDDIGYKVKTFKSLQDLYNFPLSENEYEVKVTSSEGHVDQFRMTKVNGLYNTEWRSNAEYPKVELYLKKGISPFKIQP